MKVNRKAICLQVCSIASARYSLEITVRSILLFIERPALVDSKHV